MAGSSPLARGPLLKLLRVRRLQGLIPARAGTTGVLVCCDFRAGAHPRSRGDHAVRLLIQMKLAGSSPLARGPRASQ